MSFKAGFAVAALSLSFSSFAQTEIQIEDLNYIPKQGKFFYNGELSSTASEQERRTVASGSLVETKFDGKELATHHTIGYGITDRVTAFLGTSYIIKDETKLDKYEVNGTASNDHGTSEDKGLQYLEVGGNLRFLEQNTNSINADIRVSYSQGLQDAERGTIYDANNDGDNDSGSQGNSAQIASDFNVGVFLGKKLESFEVRGGLNILMASSGNYKLINGNSDNSDIRINQDAYAAVSYLLEGQLKLNEQFYLFGNLTSTIVSDVKSNYIQANGDIKTSESRMVSISSLTVGAKIALIPHRLVVFGSITGQAQGEQKIVSKTNGVVDYSSDKIEKATAARLTIGLTAAF